MFSECCNFQTHLNLGVNIYPETLSHGCPVLVLEFLVGFFPEFRRWVLQKIFVSNLLEFLPGLLKELLPGYILWILTKFIWKFHVRVLHGLFWKIPFGIDPAMSHRVFQDLYCSFSKILAAIPSRVAFGILQELVLILLIFLRFFCSDLPEISARNFQKIAPRTIPQFIFKVFLEFLCVL